MARKNIKTGPMTQLSIKEALNTFVFLNTSCILLNFTFAKGWAERKNLDIGKTPAEISQSKELKERIEKEIDYLNTKLGGWEQIKKIELTPETNVDELLVKMAKKYSKQEIDSTDGVKIYFEKEWVHLRKSNTEPIIRIYVESENSQKANNLAQDIIHEIEGFLSLKVL